jgi:hypothetical protein
MSDLANDIRTYVDSAAPPVTLEEIRGRHGHQGAIDGPVETVVADDTSFLPAHWRPKAAQVVTASLVVAGALAGVGFLVARGPRSSGITTTPPAYSVQLSHRPLMTARQAIAMELPGVAHVTRTAAKLTTYGQVLAAAEPTSLHLGLGPEAVSARVWVVAIAGTVRPGSTFGLVPEHYTWEVVFIDRRTRKAVGSQAGSTGDWPPFFNALPDLSRAEPNPAANTLPASLHAVESFFNVQGANGWTSHAHSSSSEYDVTATVHGCSVTISGPTGSAKVTLMNVVCQGPGTDEIAVPAVDVALLHATVARFAPAAASRVDDLRTIAASSFYSGHDLALHLDSSPPPGSGIPVVDLSIQAAP